MSSFLSGGGVDCGPTNVLKNVGARVDRDSSLHQDRLVSVPNVASSSRQPFRPSLAPTPAGGQGQDRNASPSPFDLQSLRHHLEPSYTEPQQHYPIAQSSGWAEAFRAQASSVQPTQQSRPSPVPNRSWQREFVPHVVADDRARSASPALQLPTPWEPQHQAYRPYLQASPPPWVDHQYPQHPMHTPPQPLYHHTPMMESVQTRPSSSPAQELITTPAEPLTEPQDVLARTARSFVDDLENSSEILSANPKLAQSNFMSLLRGLGNESIIVQESQTATGEEVGEGAQFVMRGQQGKGGVDRDGEDWAVDFLEGRIDGPGTTTMGDQSHYDEMAARSPYPQGVKTYPALNSWTTPAYPAQHQAVLPATDMGAMWERQFLDQEALIRSTEAEQASHRSPSQRRKSVHFTEAASDQTLGNGVPNNLEEALSSRTAIPGAGTAWEDGGLDDGLDAFDEETFALFNGVMKQAKDGVAGVGAREGWGELQNDWENFQRTEPGTKGLRGMRGGDQVERYLFQGRNPYVQGLNGQSDELARGSPTLKGILELEAAVQTEPTSHEAWYALGLRQQENEREDQAILALSKVVQLEPDYRPAYLALAVSYTNEGESEAACTMIERWIRLGEGVNRVASETTGSFANREGLIERLIDIARQSPEQIDADVQEALGVLFNASEDYQKAEDCFLAALAVKPDDWLLYNRLGATLANSDRSNEAVQYYHKALSIHPNFVRALFNLSISYINLGQYHLAAQSALDALRLQHADASEGYGFGQAGNAVKGVTSASLWNTLRGACLHLHRQDLAEMVERRDLSGFPMSLIEELQA